MGSTTNSNQLEIYPLGFLSFLSFFILFCFLFFLGGGPECRTGAIDCVHIKKVRASSHTFSLILPSNSQSALTDRRLLSYTIIE